MVMEKNYTVWKLLKVYILLLLSILMSGSINAQSPCEGDDLCVVQFNAGFNKANEVTWLNKLTDCNTKFIDIQVDATAASKYKIVVVPTIVIYNGEEEVERFQANIMMQMEAKKSDVQNKIDEIIMEGF
tara:strand:- start:410 stop:796 length:387 start_codon:yes stop_codon:yes gene_type:complete